MSQSGTISDQDWNAAGPQGVILIAHVYSSATKAFELCSSCLAERARSGALSRIARRVVALADSFSANYSFPGYRSNRDFSTSQWIDQYFRVGSLFPDVELSVGKDQRLSPLVENRNRDRTGNHLWLVLATFQSRRRVCCPISHSCTTCRCHVRDCRSRDCLRGSGIRSYPEKYESRADNGFYYQPYCCIDSCIDSYPIRSIWDPCRRNSASRHVQSNGIKLIVVCNYRRYRIGDWV